VNFSVLCLILNCVFHIPLITHRLDTKDPRTNSFRNKTSLLPEMAWRFLTTFRSSGKAENMRAENITQYKTNWRMYVTIDQSEFSRRYELILECIRLRTPYFRRLHLNALFLFSVFQDKIKLQLYNWYWVFSYQLNNLETFPFYCK
jgi:hypothetical protein